MEEMAIIAVLQIQETEGGPWLDQHIIRQHRRAQSAYVISFDADEHIAGLCIDYSRRGQIDSCMTELSRTGTKGRGR